MAQDNTITAEEFSAKLVDAMTDALKAITSPEMMQAQLILLRRLALEGDVIPSRIPAPKNITEVGGYLNLLENINQPELRLSVLASILGIADPNPPLGLFPAGATLFFATRSNDRPGSPQQQAAIPIQYSLRSDFIEAFDTVITAIHNQGCQLPILSPVRTLPLSDGTTAPPTDLLRYIGRTIDLVPSSALINPDTDALALARLTAGGALQVVARQLDATAPQAGNVVAADWTAWSCTVAACQETAGMRTYLPLTPLLNAVGWYQPTALAAPQSLAQPGTWSRWINITGLVAGVTRYGDELRLMYSQQVIAASSLRDRLQWVWNGTDFIAP